MEEIKILLDDNMQEYCILKEKLKTNPSLKSNCLRDNRTFHQEFIVYDNEKIRYYSAYYNLCFSSNYQPYLKKIVSRYMSFSKITNKLTVINVHTYNIATVINHINNILGTEWFSKFHLLNGYLNFPVTFLYSKSILEKVWSKKITNPEDLIKTHLKNLGLKNISWTSLKKFLIFTRNIGNSNKLLKIIDTNVENPNLFINKLATLENNFTLFNDYYDYLFQIASLGIKSRVAYWSEKRFLEEHNNLSMKLMEYELQDKKSTPIFSNSFNEKLPKEINCRFINSEIECFKEGAFMHNCIYTNYWHRIKDLSYFAISIDDKVFGRALAGISIYNWNNEIIFKLEQIRGPRNTKCNEILEKIIKDWVDSNQNIFKVIRLEKQSTSPDLYFLVI